MKRFLPIAVFPSLLAVEKGDTVREWQRVAPFADGVHIDIMDGRFVKNTTRFSPALVRLVKTKKIKDVHLMVAHPERVISRYMRAGARIVDIHIETLRNPRATLLSLKKRFPRLKIFLAINPETPASAVFPALSFIDGVLCMTVHPGLGGQRFLASVLPKIRMIRRRAPELPIMVDGGITAKTARRARAAGASILVSGHYLFQSRDRRRAMRLLRT